MSAPGDEPKTSQLERVKQEYTAAAREILRRSMHGVARTKLTPVVREMVSNTARSVTSRSSSEIGCELVLRRGVANWRRSSDEKCRGTARAGGPSGKPGMARRRTQGEA